MDGRFRYNFILMIEWLDDNIVNRLCCCWYALPKNNIQKHFCLDILDFLHIIAKNVFSYFFICVSFHFQQAKSRCVHALIGFFLWNKITYWM